MSGFQVGVPVTRMWKDNEGVMHFSGVASSTARDKQRERMTPKAIQEMASYIGIDLLPSHDAGALQELGEIKQTRVTPDFELEIEGILDADNPEASRLYHNVVEKKRRYELSVGGRVTDAYWGKDEDGERIRFLNGVELDHVAVCRAGHAANPETWLACMTKSIEDVHEDPVALAAEVERLTTANETLKAIAVSSKPWHGGDAAFRNRIPKSGFLYAPGDNRADWRFPVYEPGDGGGRGPLNRNALGSAAGYLTTVPRPVAQQVARKLRRLYNAIGEDVPENVQRFL